MSFEISSSVKRPVAAGVLQAVQAEIKALYPEVLAIGQAPGEAVTVVLSRPVDRGQRTSIRRDTAILIHRAETDAGTAAACPPRFLRLQRALMERRELIAIDGETFLAAGQLASLIGALDDRLEGLLCQAAGAAPILIPALLPARLVSGMTGIAVECEASAVTGSKRAWSHAVCLPVYPAYAGTAVSRLLITTGRGVCVRKEPSVSWPTLTEYNVRELVVIGRADEVAEAAAGIFELVRTFFRDLSVPALALAATDSFLEQQAPAAAAYQQVMATKTELCILDESGDGRLALSSLNFHGTAFTRRWEIADAAGGLAESACIGIGLERAACALLHCHGVPVETWPQTVRAQLGL